MADNTKKTGGDPNAPARIKDETAAIIRRTEAKKEELAVEKQLADASSLKYQSQLADVSIQEQNVKQLEEYLKTVRKGNDAIEAKIALLKKEKEALNETPTTEEQKKRLDALNKSMEDLEKLKGVSAEQLTKEIQNRKAANALQRENIDFNIEAEAGLGKLVKKYVDFDKILKMVNNPMAAMNMLLTKVAEEMIKASVSYDAARSELMKLTGGTTQYNAALADTISAASQAGLLRKEAAAGFNALAAGMVNFGQQSAAVQTQLGLTAGGFKKFGIDISQNMNVATKGMGFTAEAANQLQLDLFAAGSALGPYMTKKVMQEFGPAMASLGAFTKDRAIKVFKQLAAQAAATGLAISELTGLAEKFDTYDSAATSVGRLNSLLGGDYLNSIQMLNATESERIKMLQNSLKMSGRQFSDLSRFEKKALASSVGIKDMTKAMKLFGTSAENMEIMRKKAEGAGLTLEQFQARQKATNSLSQQWAVIVQDLGVVIKPVVDLLILMTSWVAKNMYWIKIVLWGLAAWVVLKKAWIKWTMLQAAWAAAWTFSIGAETTAKGINAGVTKGETKVKKEALAVTSASVLPTLALGAAILMIGVAIAIAAVGMAQFVKAFAGMSPLKILAISVALWVFLSAMTGIVSILAGLVSSGVLPVAAAGLLGFGAAVLLIGVGIAVAALGMMLFVSAFDGMKPKHIFAVAQAISVFMLGLLYLVGVLALLIWTGALAGLTWGLVAFGAAVALMGLGVAFGAVGMASLATALEKTIATDAGITKFAATIKILAMGILQFALVIGVLTLAMGGLALVGLFGFFGGLIGGSALALFILGIGTAMKAISSDSITKMVKMSQAVKVLSDSLKDMGAVKSNVIVSTKEVFEQIGKITPASGKAASQAIEAFHKAVVDVREQKKFEFELKITHNNVKETEASFTLFKEQLNKALSQATN